jgi:hypothetical protein
MIMVVPIKYEGHGQWWRDVTTGYVLAPPAQRRAHHTLRFHDTPQSG